MEKANQEYVFGRKYPCGCVTGGRLCPEAERLWDLIDNEDELCKALDDHMNAQLEDQHTQEG